MVEQFSIDSLFRATYKNKKVFLTGHTGFKGAWLLYWLHSLGADVCGYALEPENKKSLYHAINGDTKCHSIIGDLKDEQKLTNAILDFQPDFVFHLAAQPLVRESYRIPLNTFIINAIGTANVLDALRLLKKRCVVVMITTDKVYENREWVYPYRENEPLGGYDPYSASKACAEIIINSYRNSFFNVGNFDVHLKSIASARAGNVIGGGDWAKDRLIPDIVRALESESEVIVRNPNSIRPWQHVLEPLAGYLLLGSKMAEDPTRYNEAWNFGPNQMDNLPVEHVVQIAVAAWGKRGLYRIEKDTSQPHEAHLLKLDISKSLNELGWRPRLPAEKAIHLTIDFYKKNASNDVNVLMKQNIESYLSAK